MFPIHECTLILTYLGTYKSTAQVALPMIKTIILFRVPRYTNITSLTHSGKVPLERTRLIGTLEHR